MPMATREEQREFNRLWMARRRQEWLEENGPCVSCGSWDQLEVDHINPEEKTFNPAALWGMSKTNPKKIAELEKCQVLWGPCHKEKTSAHWASLVKHGTNTMYDKGCRCSLCREFKSAKNKKRNRTPVKIT